MRKSSVLFLIVVILASCAKEYSNENGLAIGAEDCKLNSIASVDSLSGVGLYALNTRFGANELANYIEVFDSLRLSADPRLDLVYAGDSVKIGLDGSYAVLDAAKRVRSLLVPALAGNSQIPSVLYNYSYDANGYLKEKTLSLAGVPLPAVKFTYTWSGNNLVKVEGVTTLLGTSVPVLSATMTYDGSRSPKNFVPIYPDGFENALYITALNFGKPSKNLLQSVSLTVYSDAGAPIDTYKTTIKNVLISVDGYITEWYAEGDSFDAFALFGGRTKFGYLCK